jgi:ADP-heptose:LPS heptosyltransferase
VKEGASRVPDGESRILVIKLGALGDVVLAMGPFAAIRRHHPAAHIVLLTSAAYADFLRPSGWFDEIWTDDRPRVWCVTSWLALRRRLRAGAFDRIYDLQTSDRSGWYFRLMGPGARPEWSGIVRGCSHLHTNPRRNFMHTVERQAEQLAAAGIDAVRPADLGWVMADAARFALPARYALLVPGGAPHRPAKRWPAALYGRFARHLAAQGATPVVLGGRDETRLAAAIQAECPSARDLTGRTSLADIAVLARGAAGAIGNDTGPMHLIAAAGCPSLVLFSAASDPTLTAPRGPKVVVLRRKRLADLPLGEVEAAFTMR